ncbi:hypothetical protein ACTG1J_13515 [Aeromonas veronii]|uniref:hypothetical protein n=1 Tax=Aeromonas veronii TaxID=654 RepID=UPI003F7A54AE
MSNRIGKFQLSVVLFRQSHYEEMAAIQKDMAVLHIESNFCSNKATFFAVHPSFDEVGEGGITPSYEVVIEKLDDGSIAPVTFKRITE